MNLISFRFFPRILR